jgi:hypothetical protein
LVCDVSVLMLQASILAGAFDRNDHSIRAQLLGSHLRYDISTCRMVSTMVLYEFVGSVS